MFSKIKFFVKNYILLKGWFNVGIVYKKLVAKELKSLCMSKEG